jgi:branched-chain amino acid transport system ATP-binding protein
LLKIEDLCVSYGEVRVLHGVSLEVPRGEIFSLVGANGAGKSTLINTISGLLRARSGKISFQGWDLARIPAHLISRSGIVQVPEGRKLFVELTIQENLLVGGSHPEARKVRKESLAEIYRDFPLLRERSHQIAGTLSGGEQQMVAIARGLMARPEFLMLDEPSLGLAPLMVREIFRIIKALNAKGLTIFLVEQNTKQSLALCNFGLVMQNGRVVLQGRGQELLQNEFTKKAYLGL